MELISWPLACTQAVINFEASHAPGTTQVEYVNNLMDQAIAPSKVEGAASLSATDREELSSICLEVMIQVASNDVAYTLF